MTEANVGDKGISVKDDDGMIDGVSLELRYEEEDVELRMVSCCCC